MKNRCACCKVKEDVFKKVTLWCMNKLNYNIYLFEFRWGLNDRKFRLKVGYILHKMFKSLYTSKLQPSKTRLPQQDAKVI